MTYIKSIRLTTALNGLNPHQKLFNIPPDPTRLQVLGCTIYVLIYKNEQELKSKKFVSQAMKDTLVGFDRHTIYQLHIEKQSCIIRTKNLQIFKDIKIKKNTVLLYYKKKSTFPGFLLDDNDKKEKSSDKTLNKIPSNTTKD